MYMARLTCLTYRHAVTRRYCVVAHKNPVLCGLGHHGAIEIGFIIIIIIFIFFLFFTLGIKDPEGFGKKLEERLLFSPLLLL